MSSYAYEGQGSEPTTDIADAIEALINSASWTETDPARADVKFGNNAYDGYGSYQVQVMHIADIKEDDTLGGRSQEITGTYAIHVWVRTGTRNTKPAQLGKIKRQINKIIVLNRGSLASGIRDIEVPEWSNDQPQNPDRTLWHTVGRTRVNYRMTVS